jgi:flagellar biosynthesis/type III secretory pathway protein FliH
MLTAEFNMDKALEVARWEDKEEGLEKGRVEGIEKGIQKGREEVQNYILDLMAQGLSYEEIKKKIKEAKEQ